LAARARRRRCQRELSFWSGGIGKPSLLLTAERLDAVRDTAGHGRHLTVTLPSAVTDALLTRVAAAIPWRHRRRAADRACRCGRGLVPAA
jgi:hypothetical protein